jgi:tRNA (guanosine-2'-O-)-methyltransferase
MKRFAELDRQGRIDKVMTLRRKDLCLVLENLVEDQNISAILRTAEAFGIGLVCIIHSDKKPRLSKNVSSGATKWLDIKYYKTTRACFNFLKKEQFKLIGALVDPEAKVLWEQSFKGKVAVIVGTESTGLSEYAQKNVNKNIYLPMYGLTESLNVSVSAAVFMYEVIRQKEV